MFERFVMRISTPNEREKALNRIFQCALVHKVALITTNPKHGRASSLEVIDVDHDAERYSDIVDLEPERLVGVYERGDRKNAELLEALKEDIAAAASDLEKSW